MKRLELSLLNNAVTFAEDALSNAVIAEEHTVRWKFAILGMGVGPQQHIDIIHKTF